jgi:hypothetical protein
MTPVATRRRLPSVATIVRSSALTIDFLYTLKPDKPENVFLAVIAGPTMPSVVQSRAFMLGNGGTEQQPAVAHACELGDAGAPLYADPAVRLSEVVEASPPTAPSPASAPTISPTP